MAEETIVRNVRASKEVFERLSALAKDAFDNQGAALEALLNAWDIQAAKVGLSDQRTAIEDFDMHVQSIQRSYLYALDLVKGADARALDTVRAQMAAKEETIANQQEKLEDAQKRMKVAEAQAKAAMEAAQQDREKSDAALARAEAADQARTAVETTSADQLADKQKIIEGLTKQLADATARAESAEADAMEARSFQQKLLETERELESVKAALKISAAEAQARQAEAVSKAKSESFQRIIQLTEQVATLKVDLAEARIQSKDQAHEPAGEKQETEKLEV